MRVLRTRVLPISLLFCGILVILITFNDPGLHDGFKVFIYLFVYSYHISSITGFYQDCSPCDRRLDQGMRVAGRRMGLIVRRKFYIDYAPDRYDKSFSQITKLYRGHVQIA